MSSPLVDLIWARGYGEQSEVVAEIVKASLNTIYRATIRPQSPWEYAIVHRVTLGMPLPEDSGKPIARTGSLATSALTYGTVASWTVADNRSGNLYEVSMDSSNYGKTNWRLTIAGEVHFVDQVYARTLSIVFPKNQIPEDAVIVLAAASTDGTAVTAYGEISGKEFPAYIFSLKPRKAGNVTLHTGYTTADIIRDGIATWAYISKQDPLIVDVENLYGIGGEHILAYFWCINTDAARMREIKKLALQMGVQEVLPFGSPVLPTLAPREWAPVEARR